MGDTNMDLKQMDTEIGALILQIPDSPSFPSRELQVANAFIKEHPEYEKSRVEVYVSYVRVIEQMKKDGKLSASGAGPTSVLTRTPPLSVKSPQEAKPKVPVAEPAPAAPVQGGPHHMTKILQEYVKANGEYFLRHISKQGMEILLQKLPAAESKISLPRNAQIQEKYSAESKPEERAEPKSEVKAPEAKREPKQE